MHALCLRLDCGKACCCRLSISWFTGCGGCAGHGFPLPGRLHHPYELHTNALLTWYLCLHACLSSLVVQFSLYALVHKAEQLTSSAACAGDKGGLGGASG